MEYSRPASGFRFRNDGMKVNSAPDNLPEFKSAFLQNVRSYVDGTMQSRPQLVQSQAAPGANPGPILSLEPTQGVYKIGTRLFVAGNAVDTGYADGLAASILPFRPNASPNTYDYVFDKNKSSKVNVNSAGTVVVQKTGIAEPQSPPDACPDNFLFILRDFGVGDATNAGTAGALGAVTRSTEAILAIFQDPASVPSIIPPFPAVPRCSLQIAAQYQIGEKVSITGAGGAHGTISTIIQDVIAPASGSGFQIAGIRYFSGVTGRCVISLTTIGGAKGLPVFIGNDISTDSLLKQTFLASFRRGAIAQLNTGGALEKVLILSSTLGPGGGLCIETSTTATHAAGEAVAVLATVVCDCAADRTGQTISSLAVSSTVAVGTGTITVNLPWAWWLPMQAAADNASGVQNSTVIPRPEDHVHFSVNISDLTQLTSIRLLLDVNNGAADFASNFYYFDVQPNDLTSAVAGTQTQLAATQVAFQRQNIREIINRASGTGDVNLPAVPITSDIIANNIDTGFGGPGTETTLGTLQWSEINFPVAALTRVGNDMTRTLANIQAVRFQVITTGNVTVNIGSLWVGGGGAPDIIAAAIPIFYRARGRNSVTGTKGNPSPATRYGVIPQRQMVALTPPSVAYDSQIDTIDYFTQGGQVEDWRYVGSGAPGATFYVDLFDTDIFLNELLSFDNHEPFPSIGPPIRSTTATIVGTTMQATFPLSTVAAGLGGAGTLAQLGSLLPGNEFNVGQQVFTLFNRPTLISSTGTTQTYLFQFVENAGTQTNPVVLLQEPLLANQPTNTVFGPDMNGVMFSVGAGAVNNNNTGIRAGLVQWTNANDPDSASDANTKDVCPPSEALINGEIMGGYPVIVSAIRAWRGISRVNATTGLLEYDWTEIPIVRGLAAPEAVCSDGRNVYYVASDGIRQIGGGEASLTDADLSNLFPHEGLAAVQSITYAGNTVFAPEYTYAANFRLGVVNDYLYFDYLDRSQLQRTLVSNLKTGAWNVDVYQTPVTIHVASTLPASNNQAPATAVRNQVLFTGDTSGAIAIEQSNPVINTGESVACIVSTREEVFGDIRANKVFGDAAIDLIAASSVTITPVFLGSVFGTSTILAGGASTRPVSPPTINLNGEQLQRTFGLKITWTDQGQTTVLHSWQPTYITQPPDISNQFTDWDSGGTPGNKFVQGFQLEIDTLNEVKNLVVRDSDTLGLHDFTSDIGGLAANQVQANGQRVVTCSFTTPFKAHLMRLEPTDTKIWRLFRVSFIYEPSPSSALTWETQGTSFGAEGYGHGKEFIFAYVSTAPVTLTITCFDGLSPTPVVLPSTAGVYQRIVIPLSPNKGLLHTFRATSISPFQVYLEDCAYKFKPWGSAGPYQSMKQLGGQHGVAAAI